MSRRPRDWLGLLLLGAVLLLPVVGPGVAHALAADGLTVTLSPQSATTAVGHVVSVQALVRNDGTAATGTLLAHLDVVSLRQDVYVDPEDWSSERTQQLAPLAPGDTATLRWPVKAVNAGSFDVHVVLVPTQVPGTLTVSSSTYVTVTAARSLDPGGSLGVVLAVPMIVAAGALWSRRQRPR